MYDPRWDDRRERDDGRARVYDERDRADHDRRDGLMHDLDLPRGDARELVIDRDYMYELNGEDSRTLAAVGAFRVVPERDLDIDHDSNLDATYRQEEARLRDEHGGLDIRRVILEQDLKREYQEFLQEPNRNRSDSDGRPDRDEEEIRDWAREHTCRTSMAKCTSPTNVVGSRGGGGRSAGCSRR